MPSCVIDHGVGGGGGEEAESRLGETDILELTESAGKRDAGGGGDRCNIITHPPPFNLGDQVGHGRDMGDGY